MQICDNFACKFWFCAKNGISKYRVKCTVFKNRQSNAIFLKHPFKMPKNQQKHFL